MSLFSFITDINKFFEILATATPQPVPLPLPPTLFIKFNEDLWPPTQVQQLKDEIYCFKVAGMATMHKQQVSPIPASMFHGLSDVQNIQNPR